MGEVEQRLNQRLVMRDGVSLSADVYLPAGRSAAAIVARTPYNKNDVFSREKALWFADRGFAFVWVDVRGRGDSDGIFQPYRNEGRDGYDTIEWVARQGWCTGQVATWGPSYLGAAQWLAAVERPPHLAAMIVHVPVGDPFTEYPTGTQVPALACWHRMVDGRVLQDVGGIDWFEVYKHLPLATMDEAAGYRSANFRDDALKGPEDLDYWRDLCYQERLAEVQVPVLHVSAWYDDVQSATFRNFMAMTAEAQPESTRRSQKLIVGPWNHNLTYERNSVLDGVDYGPEATALDLESYEVDWLRSHLRDSGPISDDKPITIFVMGVNRWRDEEAWPLSRTAWTSYFLSSGGNANSRLGDGVLTEEPPGDDQPADTYRADPMDPVPFLTAPTSSQLGGPDNYASVELRSDVLVYSTPPLGEDLEVTGPISARIFASSTAYDTDIVARLLDVHPDGTSRRLVEGLVRARYRSGVEEELMEPGTVYEFCVDMWSTSQVFRAGHQIRLEVASAAFPKYDRNLNSGRPLATDTEPVIAVNQVWHTPTFPSVLILPVIPKTPPAWGPSQNDK